MNDGDRVRMDVLGTRVATIGAMMWVVVIMQAAIIGGLVGGAFYLAHELDSLKHPVIIERGPP